MTITYTSVAFSLTASSALVTLPTHVMIYGALSPFFATKLFKPLQISSPGTNRKAYVLIVESSFISLRGLLVNPQSLTSTTTSSGKPVASSCDLVNAMSSHTPTTTLTVPEAINGPKTWPPIEPLWLESDACK